MLFTLNTIEINFYPIFRWVFYTDDWWIQLFPVSHGWKGIPVSWPAILDAAPAGKSKAWLSSPPRAPLDPMTRVSKATLFRIALHLQWFVIEGCISGSTSREILAQCLKLSNTRSGKSTISNVPLDIVVNNLAQVYTESWSVRWALLGIVLYGVCVHHVHWIGGMQGVAKPETKWPRPSVPVDLRGNQSDNHNVQQSLGAYAHRCNFRLDRLKIWKQVVKSKMPETSLWEEVWAPETFFFPKYFIRSPSYM